MRFFDEEQGRELIFLTNAMELTVLQVADLYSVLVPLDTYNNFLALHHAK